MGKKKKIHNGFNKQGLCKLCDEPRTERGHDPCIANLPGVVFACCGHGLENGYIKFTDGRALYFYPKAVDLECPKHIIVRNPIPIRLRGDKRLFLKFKNGKKKTEVITSSIIEDDGRKIFRNVNPQTN